MLGNKNQTEKIIDKEEAEKVCSNESNPFLSKTAKKPLNLSDIFIEKIRILIN